jgi:uncharacterized membrane protein HdeD (DUF308 family)
MRGLVLVGVLLIVGGLVALTWPVISYTKTDKVVDLGPVEITANREHHVPIPPLVGGLAVAAGLVMIISRRNA